MKITGIASTRKGKSAFTLFNPERFAEALKGLKGNIVITIEEVKDEASEQQKAYFKHEVVSAFIAAASDASGEKYTVKNASEFLVAKFTDKESIEDLDVEEMNILIDSSKEFLNNFFNIVLD